MIEGPFIWGMFMQLGRRMWRSPADLFNGEYHSDKDGYVHKQDLAHLKDWKHLQYDEASWRQCTDMMPDCGCNMAVIDIGEALRFPSHPELAAEDAWSPERMADEVARLGRERENLKRNYPDPQERKRVCEEALKKWND